MMFVNKLLTGRSANKVTMTFNKDIL